MRCEVCGRKIFGKPLRVIIEGAKLTVCSECAKHGTTVCEEEPKLQTAQKAKAKAIPSFPKAQSQGPQETTTNLELIENFDTKIRQAREKLGLSQEELGKKIKEKVSVLKKIETGKMKPDNKLAAKLEHALKIKLLAPASEETLQKINVPKPPSRELTLGDMLQLGRKEKEGRS
ncbi:MAG: multiprotein bridging factor aMBF1 [Candidatus Bathyarchaeia archaeon]